MAAHPPQDLEVCRKISDDVGTAGRQTDSARQGVLGDLAEALNREIEVNAHRGLLDLLAEQSEGTRHALKSA